jgi:hypothetical protein
MNIIFCSNTEKGTLWVPYDICIVIATNLQNHDYLENIAVLGQVVFRQQTRLMVLK